MLKRDEFMNFKWVGPSASKLTATNLDVSVTKHKEGFCFIFRNQCWKKLGGDSGAHGRVEFAIINDSTIAFRSSSTGYKLSSKSAYPNSRSFVVTFTKFSDEDKKTMDQFIGDYSLKFDNTFKLNYIQKKGE